MGVSGRRIERHGWDSGLRRAAWGATMGSCLCALGALGAVSACVPPVDTLGHQTIL